MTRHVFTKIDLTSNLKLLSGGGVAEAIRSTTHWTVQQLQGSRISVGSVTSQIDHCHFEKLSWTHNQIVKITN